MLLVYEGIKKCEFQRRTKNISGGSSGYIYYSRLTIVCVESDRWDVLAWPDTGTANTNTVISRKVSTWPGPRMLLPIVSITFQTFNLKI